MSPGSTKGHKPNSINQDENIINSTTAMPRKELVELPFFTPSQNLQSIPSQRLKHQPGSIVRIKLSNFVTYEHCEFYPGPNMNMVIGPNGTGKSTIVCAIALGLAGSPKLLGRAKKISEFIKYEQKRAVIEIELKGPNSGGEKAQNIIITRTILREATSCSWKINNIKAPLNEVVSTIKSLRIQVDNLCQFLPQDKVAEFAEMTPTQLLLATQEAAGESTMHDLHKELIELYQQKKEGQKGLESDQAELISLEERNKSLKASVDRFNEREEIIRKIKLYKICIPIGRYAIAKTSYEKTRKLYDQLSELKQEVTNKQKPWDKILQANDLYISNLEREITQFLNQHKSQKSKINTLNSKNDGLENKQLLIVREIQACREDKGRHLQDINKLKELVKNLRDLVAGGPPPLMDFTPINNQINDLDSRALELHGKINRLQEIQKRIQDDGPLLIDKTKKLNRSIRQLDDRKQQRQNNLSRVDSDLGQAMTWLDGNLSMFRQTVFKPLILEVSLKDENYAQEVEEALSSQMGKAFLCQNKEDYDLLSAELLEKKRLRVNIICPDHRPLSSFHRPVSQTRIREWGFDGYVLDFIEGPEQILSVACDLLKVHMIPVSLTDVNYRDVNSSKAFGRYIAGKAKYTVMTSEYGDRKHTVETQNIRPARFVAAGDDPTIREQLLQDISEINKELAKNEALLNTSKQEEAVIRQEYMKLSSNKERLVAEKKEASKVRKQYDINLVNLEAREKDLEEKQKENSDDRLKQLQKEVDDVSKQQLDLLKELKHCMTSLVELNTQAWKKRVALIEAKAHRASIEKSMSVVEKATRQTLDAFRTIHRLYTDQKQKVNSLLKKTRQALSTISATDQSEIKQLGSGKSVHELQNELEDEQSKLAFIPGISASVMKEYKDICSRIEILQKRLESHNSSYFEIGQRLETKHQEWVPQISGLINRISENFAKGFIEIGCRGQVQLTQNEDYSRWGVDILVKFRESEHLQVLTGLRQSGGEKSVSTIMYLMAIQELAKSPFRVVDEINQGMDPHNERMIHKQLVRVACKPHTAQYFLITPKLLPDLAYHPYMKILCIFNGEGQPENFDFKRYIDKAPLTKKARFFD